MAPRTKKQKQIDNLLKEKGCYLNQKNRKFTKPQNTTNIESQEKWTEDELVEFEEVETRLMNEILRWHKDATRSLRPTGELLPYRQDKHTKLESLIDDKDFSESCKEWLRQQKLEARTSSNLKAYIEDILFPKLIDYIKKDTILERTYVVAYINEWVKRMFLYKQNMKDFVDKETFVIRSVQIDGYWKAEHMLDQLVNKDALIAKRMNLSSGEKQPIMRNGWFIDKNGKKCVQLMVFPNDYPKKGLIGKQKGLKQVLEERKLWSIKKILLVCEKCSGKCTDNDSERSDCCTQRIILLQPDFLEQQFLLEEAAINIEHIFDYNYKDLRYIDAYNKGLESVAAEWTVN
ncbi:22681_t:CDS:2, partial [Gigaspora margarita]